MVAPKGIANRRAWSLTDSYGFISTFVSTTTSRGQAKSTSPCSTIAFRSLHSGRKRASKSYLTGHDHQLGTRNSIITTPLPIRVRQGYQGRHQQRDFHDYFVTHLPSSSLHPDSRSAAGPGHKLPRSASTPHTPGKGPSPAAAPSMVGPGRELTVVRIPLKSAKHHYGAFNARGNRPYNEDRYQAGTIELPAFAKRVPISLSRKGVGTNVGGATSAESASGDPQVFYFGVFDGHGGDECAQFLKDELHGYIEEAAESFELGSSLRSPNISKGKGRDTAGPSKHVPGSKDSDLSIRGKESLQQINMQGKEDVEGKMKVPQRNGNGEIIMPDTEGAVDGDESTALPANKPKTEELEAALVAKWKETVGGYFRRFKPEYFAQSDSSATSPPISIETVLMYSFLRADLDFVIAQAAKPDPDSPEKTSDLPLNDDEVFGSPAQTPAHHKIGGKLRFKGGSTCSVALVSTPTPTPFWHPASPSTLVAAHVGDTRILLCSTATGLAVPLTTNHHPSSPIEGSRLRRYAATFVTDSFGEERMSGLANTRSFGDMRSKRIGVSAEPELVRMELGPAEYSFLVLMSDGVSGTLSDQEVCDVVKEAKTPDQGARDVVSFTADISKDGDNATCLVVRLGGWERRSEGGVGSMGTKEGREWRRNEALDPRARRT